MLQFNTTERYILQKRYSRQRIDYWQERGYVPANLMRIVSEITGRRLEELLPEEKTVTDTDK